MILHQSLVDRITEEGQFEYQERNYGDLVPV